MRAETSNAADSALDAALATGDPAPKVVVIGAGIIGICAALQLQRTGAEVVVLDRQPPGEGASLANGGILGEQAVAPVAMPGLLRKVPAMLMDRDSPLSVRWSYLRQVAPWLMRFVAAARPQRVERIADALAKLLDGSLAAYDRLLADTGAPDLIQKTGWMCVYETARGFQADAARRELERAHGRRFEIYPAEALRQVEPALADGGRFHAGVYYPDVGYTLTTKGLPRTLARSFRQQGGRILREEVREFEIRDDRLTGVRTDRGVHECDHAVVAAGAWSRALVRQLGADVPLDTERGYSLTLPQPSVAPRMPIYSTEKGIVCTPLADGLRIAGTVELGGLDTPPDWRRAELLLRQAKHWFPDLTNDAAGHWMGFRPSMPDSMPVISRVPRFPNAVLAFGHGHCGMMLGARTGELVRDLVLDRPPVVDPTPYSVNRFL